MHGRLSGPLRSYLPFDWIDQSNICLVAVVISIEMVFLYTIIGILLDNAMINWNKKFEKKGTVRVHQVH